MREGGEAATCSHRPNRRDHVLAEHADKQIDDLSPNPRAAANQARDTRRHHRADVLSAKGRTNAGLQVGEQVALQLLGYAWVHIGVGGPKPVVMPYTIRRLSKS